MEQETPTAVLDDDETAEAAIIARIVRRLIPFLCLLFVINYLDRTNVAMAKLKMLQDTGINEAAYGLGAGLFFIGYFLFEVPSNLILERVGARRWMARIMITWGLISAAMMFVTGKQSFYALRFLLGLAEAGFFPGIVLYLTYWIPARKRASVLAAFLTSTAISGILGNPLAGVLMKMEGIGGLHGWQWLFLIEGIAPVILGVVVWRILPDRPRDAKWLSADEAQWVETEVARDAGAGEHHHVAELKHALADWRLWLLSALYFMLIMGLYGFVYWVPTIIKSVTEVSDLMIGLLSAIPFIVAAVSMVIIGGHADRRSERRWHVAVSAVVAAGGVVLVTRCHTTGTVMIALCLAAIGIWGSLGPFWALSTRFLRGGAAAGGIAIVNSIGGLAGFVAPSAIGWAKQTTGRFTGGLLVVAVALVCGAVLVLCVPAGVDRKSESL
jgi:MFS transporter, ACS family, tartrate transporter